MVFKVNGRRAAVDRRAPFVFAWNAARVKPGKHVLEVIATSSDGRVATRRIPVVRPRPVVKPKPKPVPALTITGQSVSDGQELSGLIVWRVDVAGRPAKVEFLVDRVLRGTDVAAPYTLGWDASAEQPGPHRLTARAVGKNGKVLEATVTVTVPPPAAS